MASQTLPGSIISLKKWQASQPPYTDQVSIEGLSLVGNIGHDIWGRQKEQPIQIDVRISLTEQFSSAASTDTVDASTVNYADLGKRILFWTQKGDRWLSLGEFGQVVDLGIMAALQGLGTMLSYETELRLPKASRFGDCVCVHRSCRTTNGLESHVLSIRGMRLATLIGINEHERTNKQQVIVSAAVDGARNSIMAVPYEMEQIVAKTVEESSFGTLEALAEELASRIIKYFIYPKLERPNELPATGVNIRVAKPNAVIQASSAAIEIYRSAEPDDPYGRKMVTELGNKRPEIPFPLEGRLDEFLRSWKQD